MMFTAVYEILAWKWMNNCVHMPSDSELMDAFFLFYVMNELFARPGSCCSYYSIW